MLIQRQFNLTGNLKEEATIFFILKEVKETILFFSEETVRVL